MSGRDGTAETVPRQWVTAGFFDVLGVKPIAGRTFLPSDDSQRARVVVLSEAFWRTRFDADPHVIGRELRFDGAPFTVVGVVPKDFQLLRTSIWALNADRSPSRLASGAPAAGRRTAEAQRHARTPPARTFRPSPTGWRASSPTPTRDAASSSSRCTMPSSAASSAAPRCSSSASSASCCSSAAPTSPTCCWRARPFARVSWRSARRWAPDAYAVIRQLLTESLVLSLIGGALGVGGRRGDSDRSRRR